MIDYIVHVLLFVSKKERGMNLPTIVIFMLQYNNSSNLLYSLSSTKHLRMKLTPCSISVLESNGGTNWNKIVNKDRLGFWIVHKLLLVSKKARGMKLSTIVILILHWNISNLKFVIQSLLKLTFTLSNIRGWNYPMFYFNPTIKGTTRFKQYRLYRRIVHMLFFVSKKARIWNFVQGTF